MQEHTRTFQVNTETQQSYRAYYEHTRRLNYGTTEFLRPLRSSAKDLKHLMRCCLSQRSFSTLHFFFLSGCENFSEAALTTIFVVASFFEKKIWEKDLKSEPEGVRETALPLKKEKALILFSCIFFSSLERTDRSSKAKRNLAFQTLSCSLFKTIKFFRTP